MENQTPNQPKHAVIPVELFNQMVTAFRDMPGKYSAAILVALDQAHNNKEIVLADVELTGKQVNDVKEAKEAAHEGEPETLNH